MAVLPTNIKSYMLGSQATAHKRHMQTVKGNWASASNYARTVAIKQSDEPSAASARAVDKVLMLPEPPA